MMTFTFMDIFVIGGFCLSIMTFCFGVVKFFNTTTHKRIDEVKKDFDQEIKEIKDNYAHKDSVTQAIGQMKDIMNDVKTETHRTVNRIDEMWKWLITKDEKKNG